MVIAQLKPGQSWNDRSQKHNCTRREANEWLDWWMQEAREAYQKLEQAQGYLNNPTIKREHASNLIIRAMNKTRNCNSNVQECREALADMDKGR